MPQANAIIVRIRADAAEEFVQLFEAKELPIQVAFVSEREGNYQYSQQWGSLLDQLWVRVAGRFGRPQ